MNEPAEHRSLPERVERGGLLVAPELVSFLEEEALPGTGVEPDRFWTGLAALVHEFGPRNRALLEHTSSLRSKIELVSAGNTPRRIAALLLYLGERFGRKSDDGTVEIRPALTREQIGQLVNARTETVIRIMSRWSKARWIHGTAPKLKLLRVDMLQRMARAGASARDV